jgi:osmotically-inducible protein OsmY
MSPRRLLILAALAGAALGLQGCVATVVGATVGTAVGVTAAAVGTTAKVGGAVIGAAIPDGDIDCGKKKNRKKDACDS